MCFLFLSFFLRTWKELAQVRMQKGTHPIGVRERQLGSAGPRLPPQPGTPAPSFSGRERSLSAWEVRGGALDPSKSGLWQTWPGH